MNDFLRQFLGTPGAGTGTPFLVLDGDSFANSGSDSERQEESEDPQYNERCGYCKCRLGIRVGIYIYSKRDVKDAEIVLCLPPQH
jgi:hypothetical protein